MDSRQAAAKTAKKKKKETSWMYDGGRDETDETCCSIVPRLESMYLWAVGWTQRLII